MKKIILSLLIISSGLYADEVVDKALFDAIKESSLEGVKKAFEQGASIEAQDKGWTPLVLALVNFGAPIDKEQQAIQKTYKAIVYEIFNRMNALSADEFVALVVEGGKEFKDLIDRALTQKGVPSIDVKDMSGQTGLMRLIYPALSRAADFENIKFLVEQKGADINAVDNNFKRDVLSFALMAGNTEKSLNVALYLIDKGARVKPEHLLNAAGSRSPNVEIVKKIVQKLPDLDSLWLSKALDKAIQMGRNKEVIDYLLSQNIDPNAKTGDKESMLFKAVKHYYYWPDEAVDLDIIERLLKKGAAIDAATMALAREDFKELAQQLDPDLAEYYSGYPRPDGARKEQLMQLLAKYSKQ